MRSKSIEDKLCNKIKKLNIEEFVIEINTSLYGITNLARLLVRIFNSRSVEVRIFKIEYLRYKIKRYRELHRQLV